MTNNDETCVNLDELEALAAALQVNAEKLESAARLASSIDYNVNTFGFFGAWTADSARETASQTVLSLDALAENVVADSFAVTDTAVDIKNNEDAQANAFRRQGQHG